MIVAPFGRLAQVRLQRRRVHGHEHVRRVAGREDVVVGEVDLEAGDARQRAGRRADLGREVGQRGEVVAEERRLAREAPARELHAVAGVAREADDDPIALLDRLRHVKIRYTAPAGGPRMTYVPAEDRYDRMLYRRCGRSGLDLPAVSLGLWWNFGARPPAARRAGRSCAARSTSGSPTSTWPTTTARPTAPPRRTSAGCWRATSRPYRDELVISTKAGYDMWPGPYGELGLAQVPPRQPRPEPAPHGARLRRHLLLAPARPETPLEETMGALASAISQGKALYVGISSYSAGEDRRGGGDPPRDGCRLLIHQPSYSMLNRWIEPDLLDMLGEEGVGVIAFSPLAQGMLTDKYLDGIPEGSRATRADSCAYRGPA